MVKRIIHRMEYGKRLVISVTFCSTMVVVTAQIIIRYLFSSPLLWGEEFARYVYVWPVFVGLAYCVIQDKHVAITLVTDRMPSMVRKGVKIVCNPLVVAAFIHMSPHTFQYVRKQLGLLSGCTQIPISCVFATVSVGYTLIVIRMLFQTILIVKGTPEKEMCG